VKLALDHHFTTLIAAGLRERDHDVIAAIEVGWNELADPVLLEQCAEAGRSLLTNNARDFVPLIREWVAQGRSHHGLILTSDAKVARSMDDTGHYLDALDGLLSEHSADDAFVDRAHWL